MEIIRNIGQLDQKLQEISVASQQSDSAVRRVFSEFSMDFEEFYKNLPPDPFSAEYHLYQMNMYSSLSGKSYAVENEVSGFDLSTAVTRPFPFSSQSTSTTGIHLSALGFVIGGLHLPPGAKILEFGAGWGNTTIALALLGYQVTVVEIEANFCELIRKRALLHGVSIEIINVDFFHCENISKDFDAVLFYECFHHCADHLRLLRGLHKVVKPLGTLYLGAEPILPDFPVPWGLRLDGESLWAIRQNGWMELGYREDYFNEALRRTGWSGTVRVSQDNGWANLWELKRQVAENVVISAADTSIVSEVGRRADGCIFIVGIDTGYLLWGPYLGLSADTWEGRVHLKPGSPRRGDVVIDICDNVGRNIYARREFNLDQLDVSEDVMNIKFMLPHPSTNVEIRLMAASAVTVAIESLEFSPSVR